MWPQRPRDTFLLCDGWDLGAVGHALVLCRGVKDLPGAVRGKGAKGTDGGSVAPSTRAVQQWLWSMGLQDRSGWGENSGASDTDT